MRLISRLLFFFWLVNSFASGQQQMDGFDDETCGRQPPNQLSLIKGGYSSEPGEWPWHVAIFYQQQASQQKDYRCGGTLIHKYLVLTAAHCVTRGRSTKLVDVAVLILGFGRYNISLPEEEHSEERRVEKVIVHSEYMPVTHNHDIALLKVDRPVIFSVYIRPACLWKRDDGLLLEDVMDDVGTVVGWGLTDKDEISDVLRAARMPVVDSYACLQSDRLFFGSVLNPESFCAGFRNGTGACNGDSGGGMFFKRRDQWYLRGIVSYSNFHSISRTCNLQKYIGFTDAALHINWIYQFAPLKSVDDPILSHPNVRLINQGKCGRLSKVLIEEFPWMVAVRSDARSNKHVLCNGVLLNRNYILTPACIDSYLGDFQVILGDYNTETLEDCDPENTRWCNPPVQINQITELYTKDNIVLSRLAFPAKIGLRSNIEAVCLPIDPALRSGFASNYLRVGWTDNDLHSLLQRSLVDYVDHLKFLTNGTEEPPCLEEDRVDFVEQYYTPLGPLVSKERLICVRNRGTNETDPCPNFISGTALLIYPKDRNRFVLQGLLEHDTTCHTYARFINIAFYLEWILDNIRV